MRVAFLNVLFFIAFSQGIAATPNIVFINIEDVGSCAARLSLYVGQHVAAQAGADRPNPVYLGSVIPKEWEDSTVFDGYTFNVLWNRSVAALRGESNSFGRRLVERVLTASESGRLLMCVVPGSCALLARPGEKLVHVPLGDLRVTSGPPVMGVRPRIGFAPKAGAPQKRPAKKKDRPVVLPRNAPAARAPQNDGTDSTVPDILLALAPGQMGIDITDWIVDYWIVAADWAAGEEIAAWARTSQSPLVRRKLSLLRLLEILNRAAVERVLDRLLLGETLPQEYDLEFVNVVRGRIKESGGAVRDLAIELGLYTDEYFKKEEELRALLTP